MDSKLSNKLFKKYKFLKKKEMPNGIQCGNGWSSILENMFKLLEECDPPVDFVISLVEERYGSLKVHTKNGNNTTRTIIENAKEECEDVCDLCGNKDKTCTKCNDLVS